MCAQMLAEAAIDKGLYAQAFSEFGPERRGAPVRAYARISDKPIRHREPITRPDYLLVFDSTLLSLPDALVGLRESSYLIVNSSREIKVDVRCRFLYVDATRIAIETMGRPVVNTAMIGALLRVLDVITVDDIVRVLSKHFKSKLLDANKEALLRAYREAKVLQHASA